MAKNSWIDSDRIYGNFPYGWWIAAEKQSVSMSWIFKTHPCIADFYGELLTFEIGHDMDGKWSGKSN